LKPISAWLEYLRETVDRGYKDRMALLVKNLRKTSDFQQLVAQRKEKSADRP
jgi:hypothetical protein